MAEENEKTNEEETIETDGSEVEIVHPVDEDCFMCMSLPEHVPEQSKLELSDREFHYAHGFADGVSSMIRGHGWHYCERHRKVLRAALLDRGVNWSPDPAPEKRRIIA